MSFASFEFAAIALIVLAGRSLCRTRTADNWLLIKPANGSTFEKTVGALRAAQPVPANTVTTESAGVVIMDSSLQTVDEFMHISSRMRNIALQSAIGGMALSVIGMALASGGLLSPVAGAISQEIIDVVAVLNALRAAVRPRRLSDFALAQHDRAE